MNGKRRRCYRWRMSLPADRIPLRRDMLYAAKLGRAVLVGLVVATMAAPSSGWAASTRLPPPPPPPSPDSPPPPPPPPPVPGVTDVSSDVASGAALTDLGSNFLRRLGNQATSGF